MPIEHDETHESGHVHAGRGSHSSHSECSQWLNAQDDTGTYEDVDSQPDQNHGLLAMVVIAGIMLIGLALAIWVLQGT